MRRIGKKGTRALTSAINIKKICPKSKRSQEEIAGFAIIIVLVAVILIIFLGFSLRKTSKEIQSNEADSFVQSFLQYTTDCSLIYETDYLAIKDLIVACSKEEKCFDERNSCEVLNSTTKNIIKESWQIEEGSFVKGYSLEIKSGEKSILNINEGNSTNNYKGSIQTLPDYIDIEFKVYN
jgi:hypothetical protein